MTMPINVVKVASFHKYKADTATTSHAVAIENEKHSENLASSGPAAKDINERHLTASSAT